MMQRYAFLFFSPCTQWFSDGLKHGQVVVRDKPVNHAEWNDMNEPDFFKVTLISLVSFLLNMKQHMIQILLLRAMDCGAYTFVVSLVVRLVVIFVGLLGQEMTLSMFVKEVITLPGLLWLQPEPGLCSATMSTSKCSFYVPQFFPSPVSSSFPFLCIL